MPRPLNGSIIKFIIRNVTLHGSEIAALVAGRFNVTRATATNYLHRLMERGLLQAHGKTRARTYSLREIVVAGGDIEITPQTQDDEIWSKEIRPRMADVNANISEICQYGFTEMFNNVIDHSESKRCSWVYNQNAYRALMIIADFGVGIYEKIRRECNLQDDRQALLELSKGKITSDPKRHSGEGIFFTSRAFDEFTLTSHLLIYNRTKTDDDQWMVDITKPQSYVNGTMVAMLIELSSPRLLTDVFSKHQGDNMGFSKTHLHVALAKIGGDQLVSRSQAKRLMARLDKFSEVLLDFQDVESVGQGFTDEIFRVFAQENPNIHVTALRANLEVRGMIDHVRAGAFNTSVAERSEGNQPSLL